MSLTEKQLELAKRFGFGNSHNTKPVKRKRATRKATKLKATKPKAYKPKVTRNPLSYDSYDSKAPLAIQDPVFLIARIFDISNDREKKKVLSSMRAANKEHKSGAEVLKEEYFRSPRSPTLAAFKRFILAK